MSDSFDSASKTGRPLTRSNQASSVFHKTALCKFNLRGACTKGKHCKFAHSKQDMAPAPDFERTRLCRAFKAGGCTNPGCKFAHGKAEVKRLNLHQAALPFPPMAPRNSWTVPQIQEVLCEDEVKDNRNFSLLSHQSTEVPDDRTFSEFSTLSLCEDQVEEQVCRSLSPSSQQGAEVLDPSNISKVGIRCVSADPEDTTDVIIVQNTFLCLKSVLRTGRRARSVPSGR